MPGLNADQRQAAVRRRAVVLVLAVVVMAAAASAGGEASTGSGARLSSEGSQLYRETRAVLDASLRGLAVRSRPDDATYFQNGLWYGDPCPTCGAPPGMLAAVMARQGGPASARREAIATFDRMINEQTQPDGSFSPPRGQARGSELLTNQAGAALAIAYLELRSSLPAAKRQRWRAAVHRAGRWLVPVVDFYVNGNVNMGTTTFMYLAWRVTGDPKLLRAYHRSLAFTLHPGDGRWKGYGLRFTKRPQRPDWSDGRGFLAEANGNGPPGFDPYYLTIQEANAALLHAVAGTRRTARLLNVLTNTLYSRVNRQTWMYPISGGTRRGAEGESIPLLTPGAATLVLGGDRPALAAAARAQVRKAEPEFRGAIDQGNRQEGVIAAFVAPLVAAHRRTLPPAPR